MGFRFPEAGSVMSCSMSDNTITVQFPDGSTARYHTTCTARCEAQCNLFDANNVMFYITDDTAIYLGFKNSRIMVLRKTDHVLISLCTWQVPTYHFVQVGIEQYSASYHTTYTLEEHPTLLFSSSHRTYILNDEIRHINNFSTAVAEIVCGNELGGLNGNGYRLFVPPVQGSGNTTNYLRNRDR